MEIKDIRALTGMNRAKFSEKYKIPYRTIQDWENGKFKPPVYINELLEKAVRYDLIVE